MKKHKIVKRFHIELIVDNSIYPVRRDVVYFDYLAEEFDICNVRSIVAFAYNTYPEHDMIGVL